MAELTTADPIKSELEALLAAVQERAAAEQEVAAEFTNALDDPEYDLQKNLKKIGTQFDQQLQDAQQLWETSRDAIVQQFAQEESGIKAQQLAELREIELEYGNEQEAAEKEKTDASWMVTSVLDDNAHDSPRYQYETFKKRLTSTKDRLAQQRREIDEVVKAATDLMQDRRQWQGEGEIETVEKPETLEEAEELFQSSAGKIEKGSAALRRQKLARIFGGVWPALLFVFVAAAICAPILMFVDPQLLKIEALNSRTTWLLTTAGGSALLVVIVMSILFGIARSKSAAVFEPIEQAAANLKAAHRRWQEFAKQELQERKQQYERRHADVIAQRERALANLETKTTKRLQDAETLKARRLAEAQQKFPAMLSDLERRREEKLGKLDEEFGKKKAELKAGSRMTLEAARRKTSEQTSQRRSRETEARGALSGKWRAATSKFFQMASELRAECERTSGHWSQLLDGSWKLPDEIRVPIRVGSYDVDFEKIPDGMSEAPDLKPDPPRVAVPFVLPFPGRASMLWECQGEGRDVAVDGIKSVMLRLLTSLPGGKIRFTMIDGADRGQALSVFSHLADYDELMINKRIWTEKHDIEEKLTELSEHMENVFQAYLRNEYETIEEYNEQAGEVAEPYRFLVVTNFPAGFSDGAAQRLLSIARSGPKCGVYTLLSMDTRQAMPHAFDKADLEATATTFDWVNGRFIARDPVLAHFPVKMETPPRANDFAEIVRKAGVQSKDSRRVEVAFERIVPRNGQFWTEDSRGGVDVPLGRAGATKLQHLNLGRGTSQHVMIAGKTGSGKSSLLHTLIVNIGLHYAPDEMQFYLVDFKKGVEFKTYASHAMPHARIIGIESDREFGISVLERLDGILKERGELFRKVGVQDIRGFRNARPNDKLPRILLIIDEFQEFFVEDDQLSQAANLLLDRLVRQGRAFGMHVLLGSQTLGGAYSLARSTLGQIGVRIALQCSESDAHLILSEENGAARLLTRPGEAIYNDSNGLTEGNHPFQIAWLPDDRRDHFLGIIQERTQEKQLRFDAAIVFEGNLASDPRNNEPIGQAIERFATLFNGDGRHRESLGLWLGEAVSIKPPTRIAINQRPGDNLMIIGQDSIASQGMMQVALITLAAQIRPSGPEDPSPAQFFVLDGDANDVEEMTRWKQIVEQFPHRVIRAGQREAAATVATIAAEVSRRKEEMGKDHPPVFVFLSNFGRFRDLRNEQDEFGFGRTDESKGPQAGAQLADIFKDGPAVGVHAIVWCDTYSNLTRWITQSTLREFELRIAFQMNSADSSSLIDGPAASRLGGHRALLYLRELGTTEKLRPYAVPSADWVSKVSATFRQASPPSPPPAPRPPAREPEPPPTFDGGPADPEPPIDI
ncbi:MAG TPA: FtsK/SpoIIIE domain-containing protein [Planctomycetaceae bacterium]|jgi:energy-coupling factor transporter ATP-binding protein EcfA2|nr:FtsK/SpoIIIE domain-containing protein [Planctomycetaceae bacterium]